MRLWTRLANWICLWPAGGRSSVVERQLPKLYVEGSIPFARSNAHKGPQWRAFFVFGIVCRMFELKPYSKRGYNAAVVGVYKVSWLGQTLGAGIIAAKNEIGTVTVTAHQSCLAMGRPSFPDLLRTDRSSLCQSLSAYPITIDPTDVRQRMMFRSRQQVPFQAIGILYCHLAPPNWADQADLCQ